MQSIDAVDESDGLQSVVKVTIRARRNRGTIGEVTVRICRQQGE